MYMRMAIKTAEETAKAVAYAVEFTLTAYDGATVHRAEHQSTGLKLWDLPLLE